MAAALSPLSAHRCFQREGKTGRLSTEQFGHSNAKKYDLSYHGFPIFATKNVFKICEIITIPDLFLYTSLYISHSFHIGGQVISEYLFIFCTVFRHSIFFPKSRKIQAVFAPRPKVPLPENVFIKDVHFPHFQRIGPARGNIALTSLCSRENLPILKLSAYLCAATDHRCRGVDRNGEDPGQSFSVPGSRRPEPSCGRRCGRFGQTHGCSGDGSSALYPGSHGLVSVLS